MTENTEYQKFLESKRAVVITTGKTPGDIHPVLFDFQKDLVKWAVRKGRCALFADTGLGKTIMQIEWARLINEPTLILAPLAVAQQTIREAFLKLNVDVKYCRHQSEVEGLITITNYEMLEHFDPVKFKAVVLDESSILKNYTGKTKQQLIKAFKNTPYKLCCTATPAPNDLLELGNHSEFLGIMPSNEMISRWFINNSMAAGDYRLKKHAEKDFYRWLCSWAMTVSKPSDLGYEDGNFNLPPLNIMDVVVNVPDAPTPEGMLFDISAPSATGLHKMKRHSSSYRAAKLAEMVNNTQGFWTVWCDTNYEADELVKLIPEAVEVRGSDNLGKKEANIVAFSEGKARIIITKSEITGFGLNWQHCHQVTFIGVSYSFERFYQAVRRSWRFGQTQPVNVYIITTPEEQSIIEAVMTKEEMFKNMKSGMAEAVKDMQIDELKGNRKLIDAPEPSYTEGEDWRLWLGDSCEVIKQIPDNLVDLTVSSPPFANLYIYSDSMADMGNSANYEEFFQHFKFLIGEMFRVTKTGHLAVMHCKDLPLYKNRDGAAGLQDFPGDIIRAFEACGWTYHSRVTIWKDPVTEMQRTKNHGLLHAQLCKDSCASRQGMADYLVVFRKWVDGQEFENPVNHPDGRKTKSTESYRFDHYIGEDQPDFTTKRDYSIQVWQRYASPVWWDINQMNVLNKAEAKANGDEKHICPLQLDVIARCIHLWSNEGDLIFDPFMGIGSVGYEAIKAGRKALGIELKPEYYQTSIKNITEAVNNKNAQRLL